MSPECSTLRKSVLQVECTLFGVTFLFHSAKTKHGAGKLRATDTRAAVSLRAPQTAATVGENRLLLPNHPRSFQSRC